MVAVKEDFDTSVEAQNQFEVEATTTVEASQARATLEAGIRNIAQIRAVTTAAAESYGTIIEASHWSIVSQDAFKKRKSTGGSIQGWPLGDYSGDRITGSREISNGVYRWEAIAIQDVVWRAQPDIETRAHSRIYGREDRNEKLT